jgi:hypothetical protein
MRNTKRSKSIEGTEEGEGTNTTPCDEKATWSVTLKTGVRMIACDALTGSSESDNDILGVVEDDLIEVGGSELEGGRGSGSLNFALHSRFLGNAVEGIRGRKKSVGCT